MKGKKLLVALILIAWNQVYSQARFLFDSNIEKDKIHFELINNLIIIPVELNGLKLSFLLDTGVNTTVLLGLNEEDSLDVEDARTVRLKGIGSESYIEALVSENNRMRVGEARVDSLTVFLILDSHINFSPRLGFPVHGILGHDFFKDFVIEINYKRKFLRLYQKEHDLKKIRRYDALPLTFHKNKPYINSVIEIGGQEIAVTLLIDNGLADGLWLFEDSEEIQIPEKSYKDFIGLGLVGDITGSRAKIASLTFSEFTLPEVLTSFPDTTAFSGLRSIINRNGSMGAEVLRRFHLIFDYRNEMLYVRKNADFDDPFYADMAGITVEHAGFVLIESYAKPPSFSPDKMWEGTEIISETSKLSKIFSLKPEFKIVRLRKDSPAERAGLKIGDHIISINGKKVYKMDLEKITRHFAQKDGKRIKLEINRNGQQMAFAFHLESML